MRANKTVRDERERLRKENRVLTTKIDVLRLERENLRGRLSFVESQVSIVPRGTVISPPSSSGQKRPLETEIPSSSGEGCLTSPATSAAPTDIRGRDNTLTKRLRSVASVEGQTSSIPSVSGAHGRHDTVDVDPSPAKTVSDDLNNP